MSLQERLDTIKAASIARTSEETRAVMERAIEDLRKARLAEKAVKVGDRLPAFTLPTAAGQTVSSAELLQRGPLVLSFYRGRW